MSWKAPMTGPLQRSGDAALVFDADCRVCRVVVALVLRLDSAHRIRPVALQSKQGAAIVEPVDQELRSMSWHVLVDGVLWSEAAVIAVIGSWLRCGRLFAFIARRAPRFSRLVYVQISQRRSLLGRLVSDGVAARATRSIARRSLDAETLALMSDAPVACAVAGASCSR